MTRPFRFGVGCTTLGVSDRSWIDRVHRLEDQGYSTVSVADRPSFDTDGPFAALAAAAVVTTSLRLGTRVLANDLRHPLLVAREVATIDQLSGGRVELGLGAGWLESDYATTGSPFDAAGIRIARLEEAVQIVKALLSGQPFSFTGGHYDVGDQTGFPRVVQHPHPPILVGGGGCRVLAVAARHADIVALNDNLRGGARFVTRPSLDSVTHEATLASWRRCAKRRDGGGRRSRSVTASRRSC